MGSGAQLAFGKGFPGLNFLRRNVKCQEGGILRDELSWDLGDSAGVFFIGKCWGQCPKNF